MKTSFSFLIILLFVISSCGPGIEEPEEKIIKLTVSKTEAYSDGIDQVILDTYNSENDDVTHEAQYYANDSLIASNTYKTNQEGEVVFKAVYDGLEATATTFFKEKPTYEKRTLLEDYTGTWCGYCPRVVYAIDEALEKNDKIFAIAIHSGDAMQYTHINSMLDKFNIEGFPTVIVDRGMAWNENYNSIAPSNGQVSPVGIAIKTELNGSFANVKVNVEAISWYDTGIKLVVCLTENGVIYDQANFYDDGRGNPIVDFEHNHVLRKAFTDIFGDDLTAPDENNTYTMEFSTSLASNYKIENCEIVAFVVDKEKERLVNVQKVKLGESVAY